MYHRAAIQDIFTWSLHCEYWVMIEALAARNFKSLGDLTLTLGKFNCLIGMNGAGKSTTLQAIDFLSQLMIGRLDEWLEMRDWQRSDLASKTNPNAHIQVGVRFCTSTKSKVIWQGIFNRATLSCSREIVRIDGDATLEVKPKAMRLGDSAEWQDIDFNYQGSILSQMRDEKIPGPLLELRDAVKRIRSLELLAPNLMRKRSRLTDTDIGAGGEKLSSFLHGIKGSDRNQLARHLRNFYPGLVDFKVTSRRAGWKQLSVIEQFGEHRIETEARHINDGLLRVLAILAQAGSDRSLLLLDEIENGINPEIVEELVDALLASPQQVMVTTHSPMILNYMPDSVARDSVQFVYKGPDGTTRARPFFALPRVSEKLELMGPGEVFVDTDLKQLAVECSALDAHEAATRSANARPTKGSSTQEAQS